MARGPRTPQEAAALQELGRRIVTFRAERNLSQERLAERSGIDRTHIGTLERGRSDMGVFTVLQLAKGFHVDPSELLQGIRT